MGSGDAAAEMVQIGPARRRYLLGLLVAIYNLRFLNRHVINIFAEPIKLDLEVGNGQLGAPTGFAFTLFYALLASRSLG